VSSGVNYNDRALVVGKTRSGKSVLTRMLAAQSTGARLLIIDVKGDVESGVTPIGNVGSIDWSAPVVHFRPGSMGREVFAELYDQVLAAGGPTVVWLDEARGVTTSNYAPDGLLVVQMQGARLGIGHLVCCQRPYNVAVELRSEAEHFFIFGPLARRDADSLAEEIGRVDGYELTGRRLAEMLDEIQAEHGRHAFLWYDRRERTLTLCEPIPAAWEQHPLARPQDDVPEWEQ